MLCNTIYLPTYFCMLLYYLIVHIAFNAMLYTCIFLSDQNWVLMYRHMISIAHHCTVMLLKKRKPFPVKKILAMSSQGLLYFE